MDHVSLEPAAGRSRALIFRWRCVLSRRLPLAASALASALVSMMLAGSFAAPANADAALQSRITTLRDSDVIAGGHLASIDALRKLYVRRSFQPIWTTAEAVAALRDAVTTSWIDGLRPQDFHAEALFGATGASAAALSGSDRELLLSDALLRLLYQLYFGKVDPNQFDANWNYERPLLDADPVEVVARSLEIEGISALVAKARLDHPYYTALKATLQAHVDIAARGGWPAVPSGSALKPGARDNRIPAVRARLAVSGEYSKAPPADATSYDASLVEAVRLFQLNHGLETDGVLGAQTVAEMNVTADQRIDQVRVNLERARWVLRGMGADTDAIAVNIPGFYLAVRRGGRTVWRTDVVVGQTYHKTPVFTAQMRYAVLNPDWTVPRGIATREILPKVKVDPAYLAAHDYDLRGPSGAPVDASTVQWGSVSPSSFPYTIVQRPGPRNALGLVKFMFPNRHNVYLHDTPSRALFELANRTFSHGCIRVKDPLKLAEIVLGDRAGWTRADIDHAVAQGKLRQVNLSRPLRVMILYWTVDPLFDGSARFYKDVYGRDEKLLKGLNAPFAPRTN